MDEAIIIRNITEEKLLLEIRRIISEEIESRLKPTPEKQFLTKAEAASHLRISLPTLQRWTIAGTIQGQRIGRRILYQADEIDLALKSINSLKYKRS